ncbi:MAG: autotransporter-associated beta strand repeat-containing protein [Chthoniobacteraceae bacterium]|nr:autotransporter-associated beta strand repeat-containing protein [Chthoniobacteraceae bacterium]
MKRNPLPLSFNATAAALLATVALSLTASPAGAATVNWASTNGDTGNWSDTTKWSTGNVPGVNDVANFGPYANNRTITLDGDYSVAGLVIAPRTSSYSGRTFAIQGSNTLTIGSNGITIGVGNGVTISANLSLSADQTWGTTNDSSAAPLTVNGIVSGAGKLTQANAAANSSAHVVIFTGANTFSGGYVLNMPANGSASSNSVRIGVDQVISEGALQSAALGTGTVTLNGGKLSSNGAVAHTISNAVVIGGDVTLGDTANTGALTFSSAGLNTPNAFTIGSAANNVIRTVTANSAVNMAQSIGESGGGTRLGLSILGTGAVTISGGKTATGGLFAGGTGVVTLANTSPMSGFLAVNGAPVVATGEGNRLVSGELYASGGAVAIENAATLTGVTGVRLYGNTRFGSTAALTQSQLAAAISSDSAFSYGLGTGSAAITVTENYDQSALGNGYAGLVAATTGTATYTGILTAGGDGTFRVGGGAGTLALTADTLTGSGKNVLIQGGGVVNVSAAQDYTGSTAVSSTLTLSGTFGAVTHTGGIAINGGSVILDNTEAVNSDRLADNGAITMNKGALALNSAAASSVAESIGTLTINSGFNIVTLGTTPAGGNQKSLIASSIVRNAGAVVNFRGDSFGITSEGGAASSRNVVKVAAAPTGGDYIGGGGAGGTPTVSIIPWARTGSAAASSGSNFLTYDTATQTLRPLLASEFVQANNSTTATIDQAIAAAGGGKTYNLRSAPNTAAGGTLIAAANSDLTVNSFLFDNAGATAANSYNLNGSTLAITSGAVNINHSAAKNITLASGTLAFGSREGVITNSGNAYVTAINTEITGSSGVTILAGNGGGISLGGANTFSGGITVGASGNGYVSVDQDARFGDSSNIVTHAGGTLVFSAAFDTARDFILKPNVGDNYFDVKTGVVTLSGAISGDGCLHRTGTNAAVLALSGNNSYTGGTIIDIGTVAVAGNSGLGTGSLTLNGAAVANFTAAAPFIGGLNGNTATVVNLGAAAAGTTVLTVGNHDDSGLFSGVIADANTGAGRIGAVIKVGSGTQILANNNTYTGSTIVSEGRLEVAGSLAADSAVTVSNGATLGGSGIVNGTTVNGGTIDGYGLTLGAITFNGGRMTGTAKATGIVSAASGLTLINGNLAAGSGVNINAALAVNGALSGGTTTVVNGGIMGGHGTINGDVMVEGTITAGNTGNGTGPVMDAVTQSNNVLTLDGSVTIDGEFKFSLGALSETAGFSQLKFDGTGKTLSLDLENSVFTLSLTDGIGAPGADDRFWNSDHTWAVVSLNGNARNGTFAASNLDSLASSQGTFSLQYASDGINLEYTAVPEPRTWAMVVAGLGMLAGVQRMRIKSRRI